MRRLALVLAPALLLPGCLERQISITTDPPGAEVWLNDQLVGRTPLKTGFLFYGVYDVRVRKDGYEPLVTSKKAAQPWYETPPIDLAAAAIPARIRTDLDWHFVLQPSPPVDRPSEEALLERARQLRTQAPIETPAGAHPEPEKPE